MTKKGISTSIEKKPGVYRLQNLDNGRFYIGSSKNLYTRFYRHMECLKNKKVGNHKIEKDIKDLFKTNFVFGVIEYCDECKRLEREQFYFELYRPYYNCIPKVYDSTGYKWPEEVKKRNKNVKHGPKDKEKHRQSLIEAWKRRKEKYTPQELNRKMADARRGIKHSEEAKKKMSISGKGKKKPKGFAEKIRQVRLKDSEELKAYRNMQIRESKKE